jgi:hypothetical protein
MNFFETIHCKSGSHCDICRKKFAGRKMRQQWQILFSGLDDVNFECPSGKEWIMDEPKKPCGCTKKRIEQQKQIKTRESCIECVEKHPGSAMVQLDEFHDGYDYYLRIVGNLREAEDESQEWHQLSTLIRNSRKEFQKTRKIPDWKTIGNTIEQIIKTMQT